MLINTVNECYSAQIDVENNRDLRDRSKRHHPSGVCAYDCNGKFCGTCRRAMTYSWLNKKKTNPPDAPALFKMGVGDIIHEHLSELLESRLVQKGWSVTSEIGDVGHEVSFEWQCSSLVFPFSGRMDGRYVLDGHAMGVEWKSIYGMGVNDVKANGPKEDALLQCAIYLEQDVLPIEEIASMYVCRDSGYFIGFAVRKGDDGFLVFENMSTGVVRRTNINFKGIVEALQSFEEQFENGVLPSRDYGLQNADKSNKWRCDYCSYKDRCITEDE